MGRPESGADAGRVGHAGHGRPVRPAVAATASVVVDLLAQDAAVTRIQLQFHRLAGRIHRLDLPAAVVVLDVVDTGVAQGLQAAADLLGTQRRRGTRTDDRATVRIHQQLDRPAIAVTRLHFPQAVVELQVADIAVTGPLDPLQDVAAGEPPGLREGEAGRRQAQGEYG